LKGFNENNSYLKNSKDLFEINSHFGGGLIWITMNDIAGKPGPVAVRLAGGCDHENATAGKPHC
jgi:hypothetical protein